ncbi:SDR family oxidoreductase [Methylobacterium sp. E-066]|uniref:SDR family oxidoreductase n=1 Tax=Methylobacterium sp. E-066 TaxID=2836584 RepID=UPI001FB8766F|nr:SDR family oxidoreductase [Methylobacterium sp. E-066]MCJ2138941.1 SDR family oxidoreductase [Methylobacterium sp. E-066]
MTMDGQRVVVLGGTSGIGLAVAKAVAREGGSPIVVSRTPERVGAALADLPANAEGIVLDLRDEAAMREAFLRIGAFDHLVFTAGESLKIGPITDLPLEDARQFFDVRFWGAFAAAKHGAPCIRPGGSVVFTSGIAGARPPQGGWALGASVCAAMEGLTRALALELKPIRVNIVSPGFVRTPLWSDIPEADREAMYAAAGERLPVGRVGTAEDLAEAYLFLMRQDFATGQTLVVDGGGLIS